MVLPSNFDLKKSNFISSMYQFFPHTRKENITTLVILATHSGNVANYRNS